MEAGAVFVHKNKLEFYNFKQTYDKMLMVAIDGGTL